MGGELCPHVTQCGLGLGLLPYQVASWSIQPFGHNTWAKIGGAAAPFRGGGAGSPSNTVLPGLRYTSLPSDILIHSAVGATTDVGRKLGTAVPPFLERGSWVSM